MITYKSDELFSDVGGKRKDAELHESILGNVNPNLQTSINICRSLGMGEEQIAALFEG